MDTHSNVGHSVEEHRVNGKVQCMCLVGQQCSLGYNLRTTQAYRYAIYVDKFAFTLSVLIACSLYICNSILLYIKRMSVVFTHWYVDDELDVDIPVMEVNTVELTAEAKQG